MAKSKATNTEKTATDAQAADFLNGMSGQGTENIGAGDTSRNFLKIAQPTSPELTADVPIEGLKVGDFFSTSLHKTYGKRLDVIVMRYELNWNIWQPNRGGLVGIVPVGGVQMLKDSEGKMHDYDGNDIVETQNFYVLLADHMEDGLMIFSLTSTGLKHGRKWNSKILATKTPDGLGAAPIFGVVWLIESTKNTNKKGAWYTIGDDTDTTVQFTRYIDTTEYIGHVKDTFAMVQIMAQQRAALPTGEHVAQAQISDTLQGV